MTASDQIIGYGPIDPDDGNWTPVQTYQMLITTEDAKGRTNTEQVRHILGSELLARREAVRQRMPQGSVFTVKVIAEN